MMNTAKPHPRRLSSTLISSSSPVTTISQESPESAMRVIPHRTRRTIRCFRRRGAAGGVRDTRRNTLSKAPTATLSSQSHLCADRRRGYFSWVFCYGSYRVEPQGIATISWIFPGIRCTGDRLKPPLPRTLGRLARGMGQCMFPIDPQAANRIRTARARTLDGEADFRFDRRLHCFWGILARARACAQTRLGGQGKN